MQLENAMYRVIHKRKNIMASFAEQPEFLKMNEFYTGCSKKEAIFCFFRGASKVSRKNDFDTFTLGE